MAMTIGGIFTSLIMFKKNRVVRLWTDKIGTFEWPWFKVRLGPGIIPSICRETYVASPLSCFFLIKDDDWHKFTVVVDSSTVADEYPAIHSCFKRSWLLGDS